MNEILHCWHDIVSGIYGFFAFSWPAFAVYGALYAIGAAAFLLSLRLGSEDGKLIVEYDSLAYKLAHPVRWGSMKRDLERNPEFYEEIYRDEKGSICTFYASLFNMLLFIWPFVLLFWLLACTGAAAIRFLITGQWMVPDLRARDMWLRDVQLWNGLPPILYLGPLALLIAALINIWAVLSLFKTVGLVMACLLPFAAIIALIVYGSFKTYVAQPGETASAVKEVLVANKEKFCKLVEYK